MRRLKQLVCCLVTILIALAAEGHLAYGGTMVADVRGTATIWLAGQPNGTLSPYGDVAPAGSPVAVNLAGFTGTFLSFSVTGATTYDPSIPGGLSAEGEMNTNLGTYHLYGYQPNSGLSGITAPVSSLIGVFLDSNQIQSTAPPSLDFSSPVSMSFSQLSPELQQIFFIGDGTTGTGEGTRQLFQVPTGANTLYLAPMDLGNWNNGGNLQVTVNSVPEPSTLALLGMGVIGLMGYAWKWRKI